MICDSQETGVSSSSLIKNTNDYVGAIYQIALGLQKLQSGGLR